MSDARKELSFGRDGCDLEQILRHTDFDNNPTDRLSEELIDLIDQASEQEFDSDRMDSLLDALDQANACSDSDVLDAKNALNRFYQQNPDALAVRKESAATSSTPSSSQPKRRLPRLFLIAAVLAVLFASTAQASHFNIFDLFARWTSEIFNFDTSQTEVAQITRNPLEQDETYAYNSVEELLDDFGITAPLFPNWVPERFEIREISADNALSGLRLHIVYAGKSDQDSLIMITNRVSETNAKDIEKDQHAAESSIINNKLYYFISDQGIEKVIWQNGEFECNITGTVTREEMEHIISSIKKG